MPVKLLWNVSIFSMAGLLIASPLTACSESEPQAPAETNATNSEGPSGGSANPDTDDQPKETAVLASPDPDRVDRGRILFAVSPGNCAKCHTPDATGSDRAPDLTTGTFTHADGSIAGIAALIVEGISKDKLSSPDYPFAMNPRGSSNLTDEQCLDLAHYVRSLSL